MGYMNHLINERRLGEKVYVDSCGLTASFLGSAPDQRMKQVGKQKGILFDHQAKVFESTFFETFDAIFGVTKDINTHLQSLAYTNEARAKIHLATDFSQKYKGDDIPDPYYLGDQGFEKIWEMIEDSCLGIYDHFIENLKQ